MRFGKNPEEMGLSSFDKAIARIQEGNQEVKIGIDTKEENGRYFLFNMEVNAQEYDQFLDAYNNALDLRNKTHEMAGSESEGEEDYRIAA